MELDNDCVWAIGPLLPPEDDSMGPARRGGSSSIPSEAVLRWLDERPDCSVVYVCFGSRIVLTKDEMVVLGRALESSGLHFIWGVRGSDGGEDGGVLDDGYVGRVAERGLIIKGWAPQLVILHHRAVATFLSHCGWNSVLESIAAGVMMVGWPMGADQFANARLLVDDLGVALRVEFEGEDGVPDSGELAQLLVDSLSETRPERARVRKLRIVATDAVKEGGSSCNELNELVRNLRELN
ncbi:hypothetical protein Ancab_006406 [Ancistrocladus abbreviatus]